MNNKLLQKIIDRPVEFAHLLGFKLLTDLHNEWIKSMITEKEDYTLLGHRGSYKTTCLSLAMAFLIVLRPNKTIFFIRKTDDDVIEIVNQVHKILDTDIFRYIVKEIYGIDFQLTTATAYKIDTNLHNSAKGQVQLQGMGLNGSLTGKHADYIFCDDISNIKDRVSKAERDQTKRQYEELQNIKNRGGRIYNTGTPWHKDDVISGKREDGSEYMTNKHYYTVYDTGLIPPDKQELLKSSMSASLYAANYELKHISDKDRLFGKPNFVTASETNLIFDGCAHIDAAYNGEDTTAYTIMHELKDGRIIAYGRLFEAHVQECLPEIKVTHNRFRAGSIAVETNSDKGYLAQELERMGFIVFSYAEHTNKFIKISSYLKRNWSRIYWLPSTDETYLSQLTEYNEHAEHDDAADSAASLVRYLEERPVPNIAPYLKGGW